jgi:hypothetical protein
MNSKYLKLKWLLTALASFFLVIFLNFLPFFLPSQWGKIEPVSAQFVNPEGVWQQVYTKMPELSKENQYISRETSKASKQNTLVGRMIRYHVYVKGRSLVSRLDWKLTVADYLGANEYQEESAYPGYDSLKTNPLKGDRQALNKLSRSTRDRLITTLLESSGYKSSTNKPKPASSSTPTVPNPRPSLTLPKPGDAELLKP